ncbi:hypothetical protein DPMN_023952 [Dreissena polymorpha]|uniref:Uncharacterized protein n=1 Tax=Dreissena polymorpha TaxID=45954 RepID=A0A9D4LQI4_DREPO|nr:hypothetical protein DPMN_023952 [Dreissena polymorpha]
MRDYLAMSPVGPAAFSHKGGMPVTRQHVNAVRAKPSAALNSATLSLTLIALELGAQRICQGKEFLPKSSRNLGDGLQTDTYTKYIRP